MESSLSEMMGEYEMIVAEKEKENSVRQRSKDHAKACLDEALPWIPWVSYTMTYHISSWKCFFSFIRLAILDVRTLVFPDPAPATINKGPSV